MPWFSAISQTPPHWWDCLSVLPLLALSLNISSVAPKHTQCTERREMEPCLLMFHGVWMVYNPKLILTSKSVPGATFSSRKSLKNNSIFLTVYRTMPFNKITETFHIKTSHGIQWHHIDSVMTLALFPTRRKKLLCSSLVSMYRWGHSGHGQTDVI